MPTRSLRSRFHFHFLASGKFTRSAFTTAPQTQAALTRAIKVVEKEQAKKEAVKVFEGVSGKPVKADTARTAIKLIVK